MSPSWAQSVASGPGGIQAWRYANVGGAFALGGFGRLGLDDLDALVPTKPSIGLAAVVDVPLADAFAMGGSLEVHSWGYRNEEGRNTIIDLMARPRLRHVYDGQLEFSLVVPVGVMLSAVGEDQFGEADVKPGWSIGARPQIRLHPRAAPQTSLTVECGWHRRAARHEISGWEVDAFTNEVVVQVGVVRLL